MITNSDKFLIAFLLLVSVFLSVGFLVFSNKGSQIVVWYKGKEFSKFPLATDRIITVDKKILIQIKNSKVRVIENTCPNKLCIAQGEISKGGSVIVCIPNKLLVEVLSEKTAYDSLSY
ncbi:MAG: NusG domain II-containing protein [Elusimicrobiota bacterium]|nr:NusG domain II-containing protein [Elusimicrobiota bacterium]